MSHALSTHYEATTDAAEEEERASASAASAHAPGACLHGSVSAWQMAALNPQDALSPMAVAVAVAGRHHSVPPPTTQHATRPASASTPALSPGLVSPRAPSTPPPPPNLLAQQSVTRRTLSPEPQPAPLWRLQLIDSLGLPEVQDSQYYELEAVAAAVAAGEGRVSPCPPIPQQPGSAAAGVWPASPLSPQPCLRAPAYDSLGLQGTSRRALGSSSLAPGSVSVAAAPGPLPYQASQPGQPAAFTAPLPAPAPDKLCRVYSTGERLQQADQLAPLPPHSRPRSYSGSGGSSAAGLSLPAGVSLPVSVPARLRPLLVTPPTSPASMMPEGGQAGMPTGLWQARAQIIRQQGSGEGACGGSGAGGEEVLLLDTRYGLPAAVGGESGGAGESAGEEAGGGQVACAGAAAGGHYALLRQAAALLSHSRGSANHLAFNVHAVHAVQVCVWGGGREQCAGVCVGGRSHAVHGGSCRCNRVCGGHTATGGGVGGVTLFMVVHAGVTVYVWGGHTATGGGVEGVTLFMVVHAGVTVYVGGTQPLVGGA